MTIARAMPKEEKDPQTNDSHVLPVVDKKYCSGTQTTLTVWKKSLLFDGSGFTVFDPNGNLAFRIDSYARDHNVKQQVILMDAAGKSLLTLCRKLASLHHRWEGFVGDKVDGQRPIFTAKRSSILPSKASAVEVFMNGSQVGKRQCSDYQIEGSFSKRSCTIFYRQGASRRMVAEVKRKRGTGETMLQKDVFSLSAEPGSDQAFMMGLVVVLDHIYCAE